MPPLAGYGVDTLDNFSVNDDAGSNAGAENDPKDNARTSSGAVGRFREREAICIIANSDFTAELLTDIRSKVCTDEVCTVRIFDTTGSGEYGPGQADANRARSARRALQRVDERFYGVEHL